ncbi:MAG: hypothetical protein KDD34_02575 [Bdellovibrionales bacterium]|nr:hypothetical protein [Bdellovibrionales bacterium]
MKSGGYDAFFKAAKKNAGKSPVSSPSSVKVSGKKSLNDYSEDELRKIFKMDKRTTKTKLKSRKPNKVAKPTGHFPVGGLILTIAMMGLTAGIFVFPDAIEQVISKIHFQIMTQAGAEGSEKTATPEPPKEEKSSPDAMKEQAAKKTNDKQWSEEDTSYFSKLNDRKRELDQRETELEELERELNKQKQEVESRIQYLEKVRREIAGVLKDRVEVDQEKVNKLVEFYSNMKPSQAAQIISNIDEDLAIGVLSKMKKKNAAEILNMIEPQKAKKLSERFAGYTKQN